MLSPEAELNAAVEKILEPNRVEDPDHLSFREARALMLIVIKATRLLAYRERTHGHGDRAKAKEALDLAELDLFNGSGRAVPGKGL